MLTPQAISLGFIRFIIYGNVCVIKELIFLLFQVYLRDKFHHQNKLTRQENTFKIKHLTIVQIKPNFFD